MVVEADRLYEHTLLRGTGQNPPVSGKLNVKIRCPDLTLCEGGARKDLIKETERDRGKTRGNSSNVLISDSKQGLSLDLKVSQKKQRLITNALAEAQNNGEGPSNPPPSS
jgi:hypothetical protein